MTLNYDEINKLANITVGEYVLEGGVKSEKELDAFILGVNTFAAKIREDMGTVGFNVGDEVTYCGDMWTVKARTTTGEVLCITKDGGQLATVLAKNCEAYVPF